MSSVLQQITVNTQSSRKILLSILLYVLMLVGCGQENATETTVWDMPTPFVESVFHTQNIQLFAREIKQLTHGTLSIRVHAGASLYKHADIKQVVRSQQVPIGEILSSILSNENPIYQLDTLPFLATNYKQAQALWQASQAEIRSLLEKEGLILLFAVPWPPQGLYTKRKIRKIEDLKGLKVRSYNPILSRLIELAGGIPTTVQSPEIPQAFSTGMIEAMITSPSTGVSSQSWDYITFYYDIQAWIPKNMVFVNKKMFKALPDKTRTALLTAAQHAEERGWKMSQQETVEKTRILAEKGVIVLKPCENLQSGLNKIGEKMATEWQIKAGEPGKRILENFEKLTD